MGCETSQIQNISTKQLTTQRIQQVRQNTNELIKSGNINQVNEIAATLIKSEKWDEAAEIYRKIIEQNIELDYQIAGLGCKEEQIGYYQYIIGTWYKKQIQEKKIKGTPYDALSLFILSKNDINNKDYFQLWKKWYEQLIQKHPQNYQLHFGLSNLLYNQAIYKEAVVADSKVIQIKPNFVKSYIDIALVYEYQRIEKKKSVIWASKVLAIEPNNQYTLFIIARNQKDIKDKIQKLKPITDMFPKYTGLKNYNQAINWYKRCIQYSPKYFSCYNNIGVNYELMKNYEQAKIWYFKECEAKYDYKAPHANLSDVFDTLGTSDEDILLESRKYKLKQDYFCYYMGLAYYDKKKVDKSINWYEKALQLSKDNYRIYNSLAIAYDQNQDYDLAIQNYAKCIQLKPIYHAAYYNMAICYKNKKEVDAAIEWYIKATEVNPRYSYAFNNLGNIYKDRNQNEEAIKCYSIAVQHNSTYTLAYVNMAVCYLRMQNYKEDQLLQQGPINSVD